ncbi:MAG: tripartite tricarboxylate transporter substrate binding protein [Burkholderiales bacterium]|nr:tripartite tricarboxylate transporter substrate binding protein [Burkholderiales bacterium]
MKPIRIISPFAPGGGNEAICRALQPKLAESLRQQVIVESRTGANGIVGTEVAARSAPDGYTMALIPSGHAVNASLYRKLPYDTVRDFSAIALVGGGPLVLAVHPALPVKDVKDLVALAKTRPGELTYASAGVGASGHLAGALFDVMAGTKMLHVPYKGMGPAITDLLGGQVFMTFGTSLSVIPHVRSGRLRALAITGAKRAAGFPEIPTIAESGVPGYEASLWYGFVGPARIPPEIVRRLNQEINAALRMPDVKDRLAGQGVEPTPASADEFAKLLAADVERWAKVVARAGIRPD